MTEPSAHPAGAPQRPLLSIADLHVTFRTDAGVARAVNEPAQDVTAHLVGAEQVALGARRLEAQRDVLLVGAVRRHPLRERA